MSTAMVDVSARAADRLGAPPIRVAAVVLDWAGTTLDHGSVAPVAALLALFARRGVEITAANARAGMGRHKRDHLARLLFEPDVARDWHAVMGRPPTEHDVEELFRAFLPLQAEMIRRYSALIPGTIEAIAALRCRGIRIGSTSGYTRDLMTVAAAAAAATGYVPDVTVCADEVPAARPEPWMLLRAMEGLRVYPPAAVVKVGDTTVDIAEGLNAGTWTIGIARTGSLVGRTADEVAAMPPDEAGDLIAAARQSLVTAGAHFVVDTIAEVPACVGEIDGRLAAGARP